MKACFQSGAPNERTFRPALRALARLSLRDFCSDRAFFPLLDFVESIQKQRYINFLNIKMYQNKKYLFCTRYVSYG